jgi:hypothetical protein
MCTVLHHIFADICLAYIEHFDHNWGACDNTQNWCVIFALKPHCFLFSMFVKEDILLFSVHNQINNFFAQSIFWKVYTQLVKKFGAFMEPEFITVFTKAYH